MKICFQNAENLIDGISLVAGDLGFTIVPADCCDIIVAVQQTEKRHLTVSLDCNTATITYGDGKARFFRGLAILIDWLKAGKCHKTITETPLFQCNGAMVDMSRNVVMNVQTVKAMLRKMALMGLNAYMLYTEDTYEIEEYPFFGYMRGRYTKDELKELDAYAIMLGIELIPCIQMLGHLKTHLHWNASTQYRDTASTLLVGADQTYKLIDAMLKTICECFTSRRLHIGMDETHDLGTGRYLDTNGYRPRQDIFFEHLEKVEKMVRSYNLEPMMWSDMFFRLAGNGLEGYSDYDLRVNFTDDVIAKVPKGVQQVFWDYYKTTEEFYSANIDKHALVFGENPIFAGGIWTWSGYGPLFARSLEATLPALEACKKKGVQEIFATMWQTGAECSMILGLAGLAWYADFDYSGNYDPESVKRCFARSCGASYEHLLLCELPEHPDKDAPSVTRALLYNDPLIGLVDAHLAGIDTKEFYRKVALQLEALPKEQGIFTEAFDVLRTLCFLLADKADFGVRLKSAYDTKDVAALNQLAQECDGIREKIFNLRASHKTAWMTYGKPFGWEVMDIRYGGLANRFDTTKERILAFLSGELDSIEELEVQRLRLDGKDADTELRFGGNFLWWEYPTYVTAGRM